MLKKLVIFSFALFLFSVPQQVFAQSNVLILNIEKLFADSKAGKSMISQVQKKQEAIKSQRDKAQKNLSDKVQKLDSQKTMMAPDALQAKADELKLEEIAKNQELQQELRKIDAGLAAARAEILKSLSPILKDIMNEKGAIAILERSAVLIGSPDVDITDTATKRLDGVLSSVKVEAPAK